MGEYISIGSCSGYMYNLNGSTDRMIGIESNISSKTASCVSSVWFDVLAICHDSGKHFLSVFS